MEIKCTNCNGESTHSLENCYLCKNEGYITLEPDTNDPSQYPADGNDMLDYK